MLVGQHGIDGEYAKTRLVPFGEYIPFRQQLCWLTKISKAAPVNMVPGNRRARHAGARCPTAARSPIGVLICFESAFPDMARVDADHGAQVIIYQTSDSTFQDTWALAQHASLGALRAAETGRPVVQAALTGDSAAFDARGRLLSWAGPADRGIDLVRLGLPPAVGPNSLRPARRLRAVDRDRDRRAGRRHSPDPDGPDTTGGDSSARPPGYRWIATIGHARPSP